MAEITAALVKDLRERSGAGMMDCKKALQENNGDMEAAADWLRTKGLAKAAKKADRAAAEGLVAGKVFTGDENPVPFAHVTTTTTHKSLRGPRGGLVLATEEYAPSVDRGCPLVLGGPLSHVMAAKAVALAENAPDNALAGDVWGDDALLAYVPKGGNYLVPAFEKAHGATVKVIAVGSGEALAMGADVVGGLDPSSMDRDPKASLDAIFRLAEKAIY